ncbi:MAG: hypothetical protein A3K19_27945 [Lentisphaerae bacterium RIFOXYB12_FULL_65_16]|nr:MAG: hypothetical protein A3K18_12030 [Lentisphaerae bacterium RIFOXYA12_64_32]OGV88171.1 MAG: hypothetical protein A3K19_27945 [Lentisphaerae bacterium RIFOXYB12_FULL_65_16]
MHLPSHARRNMLRAVVGLTLIGGMLPHASAADAPAQAGNLLKNPSFASGLAEWKLATPGEKDGFALPEVDPAVFRGNDMASLKLTPQAGMRLVYLQQVDISRHPRITRYRVSGWRRCQGVPPGWESGICLKWSGTQSTCPPDSDWEREGVEVTAPPGTEPLSVQIYLRVINKPGAPPPAGGGTVWYDDITLEPVTETGTPAPAPAATVPAPASVVVDAFYPLGERGLFLPQQPIQFSLSGKNNDATPAELEILLRVKDFCAVPAGEQTLKLTVGSGAGFSQTIDLPAPGRLGFFAVKAEIRKAGTVVAWPSAGFCVIQPVQEHDPYFGMDANGLTEELLNAYRMIGVGSLGISQPWALPDDALADPKGYIRKQIETRWAPFWKSDFNLVGYVKIDPGFHAKRHKDETKARRDKGLFPYPDAVFTDLASAVEAEAEVMKDRIKTWIICEEIDAWVQNPNAPAGSGTCELARHILMTRIAYEKLKKGVPDSFVAGLAVCMDYATDPPYAFVRRVMPELKDSVDAIGVHPYCGNHQLGRGAPCGPEAGKLREVLLATQKLQQEWGKSKTLVIPEKGLAIPYHTPPDHPLQKVHASLHARNLIVAKSAGSVIFNSLHMGVAHGWARWRKAELSKSTDENPVSDYGIWKQTLDAKDNLCYQPRAAVAAYATVARMLANAIDIDPIELKVRDGFYCYIFQRKETAVASLWTTDRKPYTVCVALPAAGEFCDLMGNGRSIPAGAAEFALSEAPVFLTCKADPKFLAGAIEKTVFPSLPPLKAEAHLTDLSTLTFFLVNQTQQPVDATIEIDAPKNVQLAERARNVTVPASERLSADFALAGADLATLKDEVLSARVKAGGQTVNVSTPLGVIPVARTPASADIDGDLAKYAKLAPIILDRPGFLAPSKAQMPESHLWDNAADLSVKCWLTWDEKFFRIAACVTDDIHMQRQTGGSIWMDDCLQFAVDTKNDALSPETTGRAGYDDSDYNLGLALTASGPACYCWVDRGKTKKEGPRAFPLAVKREGSDTVYEVAIPWDSLAPLEPKPGKVFRFSFIVFDSDKTEDSQAAYYMALTPGIAGGQDPSQYKTFVLVP